MTKEEDMSNYIILTLPLTEFFSLASSPLEFSESILEFRSVFEIPQSILSSLGSSDVPVCKYIIET